VSYDQLLASMQSIEEMPEQPRYDVVAQFNDSFDYGRDKRALQDEE